MALRSFSSEPRYFGALNLTLPNVNASSTAELAVTSAAFNTGMSGGGIDANTMILAHPADPVSPAVAFPAALSFSHAYVKASDGKLYFRFSNPTASNYTAADVVTFHVVGF